MIKQQKIFKLYFAYLLIRGEKEETKDNKNLEVMQYRALYVTK